MPQAVRREVTRENCRPKNPLEHLPYLVRADWRAVGRDEEVWDRLPPAACECPLGALRLVALQAVGKRPRPVAAEVVRRGAGQSATGEDTQPDDDAEPGR